MLLLFVSFFLKQSAIESLFGASLTGIAYSLFAGQPLTILGSTGPVLVFEKILFKFCRYVIVIDLSHVFEYVYNCILHCFFLTLGKSTLYI